MHWQALSVFSLDESLVEDEKPFDAGGECVMQCVGKVHYAFAPGYGLRDLFGLRELHVGSPSTCKSDRLIVSGDRS